MKKLIAAAVLGLPLMASAQMNGGFEMGDLTHWTVAGGGLYDPSVVNYSTETFFGEVVMAPVDGGDYGLYFVDDSAVQTVSQMAGNAAGPYNWSFLYYLPNNGYVNVNDATFTFSLGGAPVWSSDLSLLSAGAWFQASGQAVLPADFDISMSFVAQGQPGKDIIIDNISVTAVPEPASYALMFAGLAAVGFVARRRRSA